MRLEEDHWHVVLPPLGSVGSLWQVGLDQLGKRLRSGPTASAVVDVAAGLIANPAIEFHLEVNPQRQDTRTQKQSQKERKRPLAKPSRLPLW